MTYEEFNDFCGRFAATTYVVQWGGAHVWKVGAKVFAIGGWGPDKEPAFTFKTSDLNFEILRDEPGFRPGPYLASRGFKWIQCYAEDADDQLRTYLEDSYLMVGLGLSKKRQKELGLIQTPE